MDQSRLITLAKLQAVIDNPLKSHGAKQSAMRAKSGILKDLKDRKLSRLRQRLIGASKAQDEHEEWKIANQIRDHTKQKKHEAYS